MSATPHLLKQLQAVGVVVVRKVNNARLTAIYAERLPEPPQRQVPLHGSPGDPRVPHVPAQLIVPGGLHVEVGVVEPRVPEQPGDQGRPPLGVLHQDPVQVGDVEEGVGQPGELRFLDGSAVGGGDDVDGGQHVGPGRRPAVDVLCAYNFHDVSVLHGAGLLKAEGVPGVSPTLMSVV